MRWRSAKLTVVALAVCATAVVLAQSSADEDLARRQLESARALARQGNWTQALRDLRSVTDLTSTSSADDAWLEIAKYYLNVANNEVEATTAVDTLLKKYPSSDSAPEGYVMKGRLSMAHSHQQADLTDAQANFERVPRFFPTAPAVASALQSLGEVNWLFRKNDEANALMTRVEVEYSTDLAAADAYLSGARVLMAMGDAFGAMESLQQVRIRWPGTPRAQAALDGLTLLSRLYVKAKGGPAFTLSPETAGPVKLQGVVGMATTPKGGIYYATEADTTLLVPATAEKPPSGGRPRGLTLDNTGQIVVFDGGLLRNNINSVSCQIPRGSSGLIEAFTKVDAAVQLSGGDWVVQDGGQNIVQRFNRQGVYVGAFSSMKLSKLIINAFDEVAGLDRDSKSVMLFDSLGKAVGRIPLKGTTYDLQNADDIAFDQFGHLYVLDRGSIGVFSSSGNIPPDAVVSKQTAPTGGIPYRLVTVFTDAAPTGFKKATSFALAPSGALYLYDERAQRVMVYR